MSIWIRRFLCCLASLGLPSAAMAADDLSTRLSVPPGFTVERVAGEPLVQFPMFAAWDDRGRLYVAESSGLDLYSELVAQTRRCRVSRLEDRDGDGRFDHARVFVDKLVFPMGLVWRGGQLFVADPPDLVAFADRDDDGRADARSVILTGFGHTDNGSLHGLIFGPDDRLYMTMGNPDSYRLRRADGTVLAGTNGAMLRSRADGSEPEVLARGFTNLVELAFLPDGSVLGTDNFFQNPTGGLRDALVHLVEGGLYPQNSYKDETHHVVTGDLLPPVTLLPTSGISGVVRYRGRMFPEALRGDIFTAQHNTRKVARHVLVRQGSTWSSRDEDFLTTGDPDFHPSDVLEDADGSLLVIDTGSWYVQHCPTGKIRNSRAAGGIYRVRHPGAALPEDPWGRSLAWDGVSGAELVRRLSDPRPKVCDRAVEELARRLDPEVAAIEAWLPTANDREARQWAAWVLARLPGDASLEALRRLLDRDEPELISAAARGLALRRDRGCEPRLCALLSAPEAPVRLAAAEALARCGSAACLKSLWHALAGEPDRFLEHALVYAASRHAGAIDLASALDHSAPRVQRAALLLLDQPPHACLARDALVARTGAAAPDLRRTALEILKRHPEWADHAVGLIAGWLRAPELTPEQDESLRSLVLAFQGRDEVCGMVARAASGDEAGVAAPSRRVLLEAMRQSGAAEVPAAWRRAVGRALADREPGVRAAAAATATALSLDEYLPRLRAMVDEPSIDDGLRLELLRAVVRRTPRPTPEAFERLLRWLEDADRPINQLAAAEVLARTEPTAEQLVRLLDAERGNLLFSPALLLPLLERSTDERTAPAIVNFLRDSVEGGWRPAEEELARLVAKLPRSARPSADQLLERLRALRQRQAQELAEFLPLIRGGDIESGRAVFFNKTAACSSCHRVGDQGGQIGPDLTRIGVSRSGRDLLESIVVPGSTIAQGYESYLVQTADGRVYSGIIGRQTPELVVLLDSARNERRFPRDQIEQMGRQPTSIMPEGFGRTLTRKQLEDLLAFLQSLK